MVINHVVDENLAISYFLLLKMVIFHRNSEFTHCFNGDFP